MPFGHSGYLAMMSSNVTKRVTFLVAETCGMSRQDADFFSDEVAITANQAVGTAFSIATVDPVGFGLTAAHTAMLENDLARKRAGRG
jgi:hypothetical protein